MDTWIMPPIMMFYPDMARMMIGSRIRVLPVVRERARANGYQGAQFPWEQAFTGRELVTVPMGTGIYRKGTCRFPLGTGSEFDAVPHGKRHLQVGILTQFPMEQAFTGRELEAVPRGTGIYR